MKRTSIGGQAVIEGVMMRGKTIYAMAVRNPEGGITLEEKNCTGLSKKYKIFTFYIPKNIFNIYHLFLQHYHRYYPFYYIIPNKKLKNEENQIPRKIITLS